MTLSSLAKFVVATAIAAVLGTALPSAARAPEVKRIEVVAKRFAFVPAEVTLKKGEPVVLVFTSEDVAHGVKFKELNLQTVIKKGEPSEISFTPTQTGDFVGHCSVFCGAGHGSMVMTLHVTE